MSTLREHFPLSKYTIWKLTTASEIFQIQILQKYHIKKIYIFQLIICKTLLTNFTLKVSTQRKKKKKRRNAKKVSSILIAFFNLEIPLGYTKVALGKTSQYNERHARKRGNCGDRKKRGPSGGNSFITRIYRAIFDHWFVSWPHAIAIGAICCERTIDLPTNFVEISLITRSRLDLRHFYIACHCIG